MNGKKQSCCPNSLRGAENRSRSWNDPEAVRDFSNRLNRIEGQIRGIKRMIETGVYCDDILNQIASAQAALNSVGKLLLEKHMQSCIMERLKAGDDAAIGELTKTIARLINKG